MSDSYSAEAGAPRGAGDDAEPPGSPFPTLTVDSSSSSSSASSAPCCESSPPAAAPRRPAAPRFRLSRRSAAFYRRFFPASGPAQWNDWQWQLRCRIRNAETLARMIRLSPEEDAALSSRGASLPFAITPYYAGLIDPEDPAQAIRRSMVPVTAEAAVAPGEAEDPLGEEAQSPVPGLIHRYPDRALFLATGFCSAYCRYCTRSRFVGHGGLEPTPARWKRALEYLAATPAIRDVLISGGDPLTLSDERLEWLLSRLRAIPHIEIVRIGTKVPMVLPQRITRSLLRVLRAHHPLWISIHCTHPDELTPEAEEACARLADAGIPLGSQTVLLKGINDAPAVLGPLMRGLLRLRVRPYYLYQCDPILGSAHFRTPIQAGLDAVAALRGHTTGYAVPTFVVDAPGGGGKIPVCPESRVGQEAGDALLRNWRGEVCRYPEPER